MEESGPPHTRLGTQMTDSLQSLKKVAVKELDSPGWPYFSWTLHFRSKKVSHHLKQSANCKGTTEGNFIKCLEAVVEVVSKIGKSNNFSLSIFP